MNYWALPCFCVLVFKLKRALCSWLHPFIQTQYGSVTGLFLRKANHRWQESIFLYNQQVDAFILLPEGSTIILRPLTNQRYNKISFKISLLYGSYIYTIQYWKVQNNFFFNSYLTCVDHSALNTVLPWYSGWGVQTVRNWLRGLCNLL